MYLEITNAGEISEEAFTLLGASTKREDESKIGYFGSGNKYAIATMLRNGIEFEVWAGTNRIMIESEKVNFRGQEFDRIRINGKETGLTVQMGPQWEPWFAVREIYCNALDEGDCTVETVKAINPENGLTKIYLKVDKIMSVIQNWNDFFSDKIECLYEAKTHYGKVKILNNTHPHNAIFYRKGIRVYDVQGISCFRYDFDDVPINESRTIFRSYEPSERAASALAMCTDKKIIMRFLELRNQKCYEAEMSWAYVEDDFSQEWEELLEGQTITPRSALMYMGPDDALAAFIVQDDLYTCLKDKLPNLNYFNDSEIYIKKQDPSSELSKCFWESFRNVHDLGFTTSMPFEFVKMKNPKNLACYHKELKEVYISVDHPVDVIEMESTIVEEIYHENGFNDGTRAFENHLMKELISAKKILKEKGETKNG